MSLPISRRELLAALPTALALPHAVALAQAEPGAQAAGPITLEIPLQLPEEHRAVYSIARAEPDGTVELKIPGSVPENVRGMFAGSIAEGYYVLIAKGAGGKGPFLAIRAQVTDVAEGPVVTLRTGAGAAAKLRAGSPAALVRPWGSTTALLRSLPDSIPIETPKDQGNADQLARRGRSINNLKQIGLALHNFHSTQGRFPAAAIVGPDGKPWHSWRVLILPYIEQVALFNQYDFNQPWDSEKNRKLLDRMPDTYRDPAYGDAKTSFAHYAALVGPQAVFPAERPRQPSNIGATVPIGKGGRSMADILDGSSNTWAVAPVDPARKIPWTKPEDINVVGPGFPVGPDFPGLGKPGGIATPYTLGGKPGAAGVAPILYLDGSVHLVAATIKPVLLNAMITCQGGEVINPAEIPEDHMTNQTKPPMLKIRIDVDRTTATIE